jgi:DNA topoisomerase-1
VLRQGSVWRVCLLLGYPKCKYVKQNLIEGMKCPKCGEGDLAERKARRGNIFWGCTNYPKCDFTSNYKPVAKKCPKCKSPYLLEKTLKSGVYLFCPNSKPAVAEEAAPKKVAKKTAAKKGAAKVVAKVVPVMPVVTEPCEYEKRIGDAPPPPTAETHGPSGRLRRMSFSRCKTILGRRRTLAAAGGDVLGDGCLAGAAWGAFGGLVCRLQSRSRSSFWPS